MKIYSKSIPIQPINIEFLPDKDPLQGMDFRVELNKPSHILRNQCFQRVKDRNQYETKHFTLKIRGREIGEDEILDEDFLTKHKIFFEYNLESNSIFDTEDMTQIQVPVINNKQIHVKIQRAKNDKVLICLQNRFEYNLPKQQQINEIKARLYREGVLRKAYQAFDLVEEQQCYSLIIKNEDISKVVLFIKDKGIIDKVDRNKPFYKLSPDEFIEEYQEDNALLVKVTGKDKKMITKDFIDISQKNDRLTFQNLTNKLYLELEIIRMEQSQDKQIELDEIIKIELNLINFCTQTHECMYQTEFNIYNNIFDLENMLKFKLINKNMRFYKQLQDYNEEQQQLNRNNQQVIDKSIYGLKLIREILSAQQMEELERENQQKLSQLLNQANVEKQVKYESKVKLELFVSI